MQDGSGPVNFDYTCNISPAQKPFSFDRPSGRALLAGCNTPLIPPQGEKLKEAEHYLTQAVAGLRQWNNRTNCHTAFSSEQRCTAFRKIGRGLEDLNEAQEIAERGEMAAPVGFSFGGQSFAFGAAQSGGVVYPRIRRGEIYFALPENHIESAKGQVKTAKEMIDKMGYHRRDPELDELRSLISKIK